MSEHRENMAGQENPPAKKKNRWVSWLGILCSLVITGVVVWFAVQIWQTQFVPADLMKMACLGLGAVLLVSVLLLLNHRHVVRFILGVLLSAAMICALVMGGRMVPIMAMSIPAKPNRLPPSSSARMTHMPPSPIELPTTRG